MGHLRYIIPILTLAGCGQISGALSTGVETIKQIENGKAILAVQAPCAMSIGAKHRVLTAEAKAYVEALCGGPSARPVTAVDIQRMLTTPILAAPISPIIVSPIPESSVPAQ